MLLRYCIENFLLIPEPFAKNSQPPQPLTALKLPQPPPKDETFHFDENLQSTLAGRALLMDELSFSVELLYEHYLAGYILWEKGIRQKNTLMECRRCGNKEKTLFARFECARCKEMCTYCRKCIMMGRVSTCTALLSWRGDFPVGPDKQAKIAWKGTLSSGQRDASEQMISAIQERSQRLIWAVCGAGKTEVLFPGIHYALKNRMKVCLATPRTDVVLELLPRLRQAFPNAEIVGLYGGSGENQSTSSLMVSTTHQLLRFHQAFDVIIVDEVDAFPFSYDESLHYEVKKASKQNAAFIYLTATPTKKWQRTPHVKIPARYHGHPLPQPKFSWCGNWEKKLKQNNLPQKVEVWVLNQLQKEEQALIFFPSVNMIEKALPLFQALHKNILSVHANDKDRKEKVEKLRRGEIPLLITTTILERGITISNLNVAVIGAEQAIFTESALVQIAGRVGRDAEYPMGEVTFFHYGKSSEMEKALLHIMSMNRVARKKGYFQ
ncbi:DEAD/DEAH box helicase [Bacillus sp. 2205SS5-2]|uniref:DEAD/DEAH box helicase n=1 Tax=Bacillus sp. 2205SS5-2 TaxID=3109031 RepID=UPI003FA56A0B